MRYKKDARVKFVAPHGKTIYGTIVDRIMDGRKTVMIMVKDDQNKIWNIQSMSMLQEV